MPGFAIECPAEVCGDDAPNGSEGNPPSATVETSRRHRFEFVAFEPLEDILIYAHKTGRPRPEIDRITIHHSQEEIYSPGKNRWLPIDITFYEGHHESDQVAEKIYEWWSSKVLDLSQSLITTSDFKKNCELSLLDGENNPVWMYRMYGCWPSKVSPDDLDYADTGIAEISFTLEMDKAEEVFS